MEKKSKPALPAALRELAQIPERPQGLTDKDEREFGFRLKIKLWHFEPENLQYIVFYHRDDVWWQCGDNSMILYYYWAAPQLGRRELRIRHDNDYTEERWRHGYITVKNMRAVKRNLEVIGCECVIDTPEIKAFRLPKAVNATDMDAWQHSEQEKEARFNQLVVPKNIYPKVLSKVAGLHRDIVNKAANLTAGRQKYYGDYGADRASWLSMNAIRMANNRMSPEEYFTVAIEKLDELKDWLAYVKKFDMFSIDADLRIARDIVDTQALVKTELALYTKGSEKEEPKDGAK